MRRCFGSRFCAVVVFACPVAASFGQPTPSPRQSPPAAETSSQNATPSQDKQDSVAEAARKTKETKAAAAKGKVFTEDDLAGLRGGVSVVGTENKKQAQVKPTKAEDAADAQNGEAYWRGKAQPILQEVAEIDQLTTRLAEDIKKYGTAGIDVTSGMKDGVAYVRDRNAQVQKLQKKRADLQKKLDELEEEGRKGGAEPAWFR
jgi:chromosome segregation ATPase